MRVRVACCGVCVARVEVDVNVKENKASGLKLLKKTKLR